LNITKVLTKLHQVKPGAF